MEGNKLKPVALIAVILVIGLGLMYVLRGNNDTIIDTSDDTMETEVEDETEEIEEETEQEIEEPEQPPVDPLAPVVKEVDRVYKTDSLETPSWVPQGINHPPWEGSIYLASSSDGLTFTDEKFFVQHAGVPNLLLTQENKVVATFQYFSYEDEDFFEVIGYTVSEDNGETWSKVRAIQLEERYNRGSKPVDPTLVQLEDGRFRLYYTYHEPGTPYAAMYSSSSTKLDGIFEDEGKQLEVEGMLLDPAVVYYNGVWHHYTINHDGPDTIHSTSEDGLGFIVQDSIESDYQFLGDAIENEGKLRFYGTGQGIVVAESEDGYTFTKIKENAVDGADPGIVKLPEGGYLIVYTKAMPP